MKVIILAFTVDHTAHRMLTWVMLCSKSRSLKDCTKIKFRRIREKTLTPLVRPARITHVNLIEVNMIAQKTGLSEVWIMAWHRSIICTNAGYWNRLLVAIVIWGKIIELTHRGLNKITDILQMTYSNRFSLGKNFVFWLVFPHNVFRSVQLTTSQHWLRWGLGAE